jgi:hypothetical protein
LAGYERLPNDRGGGLKNGVTKGMCCVYSIGAILKVETTSSSNVVSAEEFGKQ